ncbi:hypothetical protein L484_000211 [Morus notabilis]|uniref:Uncharacterized protein n=1 Tax=Morus notabilis TaxID=981085 RepID=W9SP96_9ROSA|nr:hypothetical protein L484_000211 [Morus notabilis]
MVSLRFISSLLVLTMLYRIRYCSATTKYYQAFSKIAVPDPSGSTKVGAEGSANINSEKKTYNGVQTMADVGNKRRRGRKMMVERVLPMLEEEHFVGDYEHFYRILNVKCNLKSTSTRRRRLKAKMTDFRAFNADYHVPRPHPPKNN